jgi:hypothetical protein
MKLIREIQNYFINIKLKKLGLDTPPEFINLDDSNIIFDILNSYPYNGDTKKVFNKKSNIEISIYKNIIRRINQFSNTHFNSLNKGLYGKDVKLIYLKDPYKYLTETLFEIHCILLASCELYINKTFFNNRIKTSLINTVLTHYEVIFNKLLLTSECLKEKILSRIHIYKIILTEIQKKRSIASGLMDNIVFSNPFIDFQIKYPFDLNQIEGKVSNNVIRQLVFPKTIELFYDSLNSYFIVNGFYLPKKHIIHVDDHLLFLQGFKKGIDEKEALIQFVQFQNPDYALNYIKECFEKDIEIDLIISDINQPIFASGLDFVKKLSDIKNIYKNKTPIVLISMMIPEFLSKHHLKSIDRIINEEKHIFSENNIHIIEVIKDFLVKDLISVGLSKNTDPNSIKAEILRLS